MHARTHEHTHTHDTIMHTRYTHGTHIHTHTHTRKHSPTGPNDGLRVGMEWSNGPGGVRGGGLGGPGIPEGLCVRVEY